MTKFKRDLSKIKKFNKQSIEKIFKKYGRTTRVALALSIEKWERIRDNAGSDLRKYPMINSHRGPVWANSCGLCYLFLRKMGSKIINKHIKKNDDCKKCPVYKRTGMTQCKGTPYINYPNQLEAMREVTFLKSLRK